VGPDRSLRATLQRIKHAPKLDPEQMSDLARRYQETGDPELAEALVTANLGLVVKIAMKYRSQHGEVLDLVQEGHVGLLTAVNKFDATRGVPFTAYARYWVRAMVLRYVMENHRIVTLGKTRGSRKLFFQLARERRQLRSEGPGAENRTELARRLGVDEQELDRVDRQLSAPAVSLDTPREGAPDWYDSLQGHAPDPELEAARRSLSAALREVLADFGATLEGREAQIFYERLVAEDPRSLADLGKEFGVSRERARQLEARLKRRLKAELLDTLGPDLNFEFVTPAQD
jgi:RNA polymerase sigma-32 factor